MSVERLLAERAVDRELVGAPISRRSRQTARSLDAYLRAGGRPRWMERLSEIEGMVPPFREALRPGNGGPTPRARPAGSRNRVSIRSRRTRRNRSIDPLALRRNRKNSRPPRS